MKKFDIEDLDRKMPYEIPEGFFPEMQNNVFQRIAGEEKGRKNKQHNFWWVAASVILLAGLGFLIFPTTQQENINSIAHNIPAIDTTYRVAFNDVYVQEKEITPQNIPAQKPNIHPRVNKTRKTMATHTPSVRNSNTNIVAAQPKAITAEMRLEDAVNQLDIQELAELSDRYEIDTYLELY